MTNPDQPRNIEQTLATPEKIADSLVRTLKKVFQEEILAEASVSRIGTDRLFASFESLLNTRLSEAALAPYVVRDGLENNAQREISLEVRQLVLASLEAYLAIEVEHQDDNFRKEFIRECSLILKDFSERKISV